jgi:hypothetical protein
MIDEGRFFLKVKLKEYLPFDCAEEHDLVAHLHEERGSVFHF